MRVAFTKSEWLAVTMLYRSEKVEELRRAVAILQMWRVRMGNSLHVAAEMSEVLLAAIIADKEANADDWLTLFNLRLLYSAAVIRFVNYVNELCQRKRPAQMMSVRAAVSMMNVPGWVVQVRHEATHAHLPPLKRLREAAEWCREWLWCNHWEKPIDEAMRSEEEHDTTLQTVNDRLIALIDAFIKHRISHPNEDLQPNIPTTNGLFNKLEKMILSHTSDFIEAFLLDGYLIMTENQLVVAAFDERTNKQGIWRVPAPLQMFWRPILSMLNRAKALPQLLYQLIISLGVPHITDIRRRQLVGWADRMLDAFVHSQQLSEIEWKRLMRGMLTNREHFTDGHLEAIADKIASLTGRKRQNLEHLLTMSPVRMKKARIKECDSHDQVDSCGTAAVKTVVDLFALKQNANPINEAESGTVNDGNAWILCDASIWKGVPLGLTPNQNSDTLMLVIDGETFVPRKCWQT